MKIDITSMFFNSKIEGQTATPAWGTSIGQNKTRECRIDDFKKEVIDMIIGMTYKSISDISTLDVSKGSPDREILICSVFNNIHINNIKIDNSQFVLLLVREHSKSHNGRLLLSYAPYIKYNEQSNQDCINKMQEALDCTSEGCWFVYDITIKNQSDLYFSAVVVNPTAPMIYGNTTKSKNRSDEWKALIPTNNIDYKNLDSSVVVNKIFKSYLSIFRTKPFLLLAGISGTGKSRIVKEMAYASCPEEEDLRKDAVAPGNYLLVEVKPNWHDSTELLGYESTIKESYILTPFVKFLYKAMKYPNIPFFVCLDEMNLAPVEQYFAEFLSILESRKLLEDGETILTEPLIKADIFKKYPSLVYDLKGINKPKEESAKYNSYDIPGTYEEQEEYRLNDDTFRILKTDGLRIPQNVLIVGTVNMDETTHQFSRKVIDRAMTIEMNEVKFDTFFDSSDELGYIDEPLGKEYFLPKYTSAKKALESIPEDAEFIKKEVPKLLEQLNKALDGTPFKIAYRVQNELVLYFVSLREETKYKTLTSEELLSKAMDGILMMKVLPRIEGDKDLLEEPFKRLEDFAKNYTNANAKIEEMQTRLKKSHYTSFWP